MTNEEIELKACSALYDSSLVGQTMEERIADAMRELVAQAFEEAAQKADLNPQGAYPAAVRVTAEKIADDIRALKDSLVQEPVS